MAICETRKYVIECTSSELCDKGMEDRSSIIADRLIVADYKLSRMPQEIMDEILSCIEYKKSYQQELLKWFENIGLYKECKKSRDTCCRYFVPQQIDDIEYLQLALLSMREGRPIGVHTKKSSYCAFYEDGCTLELRPHCCITYSNCIKGDKKEMEMHDKLTSETDRQISLLAGRVGEDSAVVKPVTTELVFIPRNS
ncbi:MAG: hypothetical protein HZB67_00200 [Candidatus Aenigmarchaeota archaeon]|nr:hypothetical protein [Candidatus Aenigmarchaeota archaeon]